MTNVIITAPSLDPMQNVSGVSSVVNFIIDNNPEVNYLHFELGKKDKEKGGLHRIKRILKCYANWRKIIKENPDAIIHYSYPLSGFSIIRDFPFLSYCIKKKRKLVVHIHGGVFLTAPQIPVYLKVVLKKVFSWNVPFIVLSDSEVKILKNRFNAKNVISLPNSVDLKDAEEYAKETKCFVNNPLTIGYLGRIEPNKGMAELLAACQTLQIEGVPFKLNLAGKEQIQDEFLPHFDQRLGDNFHYAGLVSGKTKCEFIRSLDLFVLPSYFEGLPMSLLECMSYGVVPVVTPVGSIPAVVKNGENGVFINVKDSNSIVDSVKKMNNDRLLVEKLSENARKTIFKDFSPQAYIKKLNEIYEGLCFCAKECRGSEDGVTIVNKGDSRLRGNDKWSE